MEGLRPVPLQDLKAAPRQDPEVEEEAVRLKAREERVRLKAQEEPVRLKAQPEPVPHGVDPNKLKNSHEDEDDMTSSKTTPTSQPVSDPTVVPTRFFHSSVPQSTSQPSRFATSIAYVVTRPRTNCGGTTNRQHHHHQQDRHQL